MEGWGWSCRRVSGMGVEVHCRESPTWPCCLHHRENRDSESTGFF